MWQSYLVSAGEPSASPWWLALVLPVVGAVAWWLRSQWDATLSGLRAENDRLRANVQHLGEKNDALHAEVRGQLERLLSWQQEQLSLSKDLVEVLKLQERQERLR